jgi:hypothetical protein
MNPLAEQLAHAYREQQRIYEEIKDLVGQQIRAMEEQRDARAVLALCQRVEQRMADIAVIEDAIEPAKRKWEQAADGPTDGLDAVLAFVEAAIDEIVRGQERVQQKLVEYMQQHKQRAQGARTSIDMNRARTLYRAG